MALKPQAIELHIEEVVLDGFARRDRHAIGDAIERELSRLLAERGIEGSNSDRDHIDAGRFRAAAGAKPQAIGASIADCVHKGLAR
jgi:hypothetical protein